MDEDGFCVVCQDAHKMIDSCLQNVQCKNCSKKGHLRIDCPQDSPANEESEIKSGCAIKRKAQLVIDEVNVGNKVCCEVPSKSSSHPSDLKIYLESNDARIITSDNIKVEHQESDSIKQEYYEEHISKKETVDENMASGFPKVEYFEEISPDSVKRENIGDCTNSSASDTKPDDDDGSDNPVLVESVTPVPVKWTPTGANFWQLKNQKKMYVLCPGDKCNNTLVNISIIANHIQKVHPNFKEEEIFCKFCQANIIPKNVSTHMPKCFSMSLGKSWLAPQNSAQNSRTKPDLNSKFWQNGPQNTLVCPNNDCDFTAYFHQISEHIGRYHPGMMKDQIFCKFCKVIVIPAQVSTHMEICSSERPMIGLSGPILSVFPLTSSRLREDFSDFPLLQGLSSVPINSDGLSFFSAKMFLDFYLVTNFAMSKVDTMKCSWMFMNYMETNKVKGRTEVLSPTRFLLLVKELSSDRWSKDVGPFREKQSDAFESLYFIGLRLKDQYM